MMRILVLVKQIPDLSSIRFDASTGRIIRENVQLQINSFDKKGLEEAVRIKEKHGAEVIVATMGPPSASDVLNLGLRMGADRGILITDRKFAGADTLVTSTVLAALVHRMEPDLVFAGKYSLDGETSQVPPEAAVMSGFSFRSAVTSIEFSPDMKSAEVECERETGLERTRVTLPSVFSVSEKLNKARFVRPSVPDMSDRIEIWDSVKLGVTISGSDSPTVVEGTEAVDSTRRVMFLDSVEKAYEIIAERGSGNRHQPESIHLEEEQMGREYVWGIAFSDKEVAREIAAKICDISRGNFNVRIIGNIDPSQLEGLPCHEYVYVPVSTARAFSDYLTGRLMRESPPFVVLPSTVDGRDIAGTIAGTRRLGLTADCIDLQYRDGKLYQYKPAFGGGVVARIVSRTLPAMATVRRGVFKARNSPTKFRIIRVEHADQYASERIGFEPVSAHYESLFQNRIVIAVGKGMGGRENLEKVLELARNLKASVGATRPIVDLGWVPRQQQVGITGFSISPDVYIAVGISGHDNHVFGIRYAGTVISVNNSADAPIFKYSDYGLVMDSVKFLEDLAALARKSQVQ